MLMLRTLRRAAFRALKTSGLSSAVAGSAWRRSRLLILCYHSISIADEYQWRPLLYMSQSELAARFQLIKDSGATVLPLTDALQGLYAGTLPEKSVAITFDDGAYNFYYSAYPIVRDFGFPVTVYQTTYHADFQKPIFNLACSYMLWKRRETTLIGSEALGISGNKDLSSEANRQSVVNSLIAYSAKNGLNGMAKDELAQQLAQILGFDYEAFCAARLLHLMSPVEIAELSGRGVDFQLHTHRHRTPRNEELFRKEIRDNRRRLEEITGRPASHFCYPSGIYHTEFLPWLAAEGVASATTCEGSRASSKTNALVLPRFVDTIAKSALEFESWLDGSGLLLARHPASRDINYE
jgi:peptidoglycan/xylan/chitin deacetylase (PgdA/CDA1 family)